MTEQEIMKLASESILTVDEINKAVDILKAVGVEPTDELIIEISDVDIHHREKKLEPLRQFIRETIHDALEFDLVNDRLVLHVKLGDADGKGVQVATNPAALGKMVEKS